MTRAVAIVFSPSEARVTKIEFRRFVFCSVFWLSACSLNPSHAPSGEIARMTVATPIPHQSDIEYRAPLLRTEHWRVSLGGEDTQSFRLVGHIETGAQAAARHWLAVETEYGGKQPADYRAVQFPGGLSRSLRNLEHRVVRCQVFNTMQSACLYRDDFIIDLLEDELKRFANSGMRLTLLGRNGDQGYLYIPASYLQGYLSALGEQHVP